MEEKANVEESEVKINKKTTKVWKGIKLSEFGKKVTEVTDSYNQESKAGIQDTLFYEEDEQ